MATVVDTVVLQYFLLVEEPELLFDLLDPPVGVPRIVYDPGDGASTDMAVSELRRSIRYEERLVDTSPTDADRQAAIERARRIRHIDQMIGNRIQVLDMTGSELDLFQGFTADEPDEQLGLFAPLGAGEAACIAIALERGHVMATDDSDALRVLHRLRPGHPYERIRRLLRRAGEEGVTSQDRANDIHQRMREMGFWDTVAPFPGGR
jgi:hypothetical protein